MSIFRFRGLTACTLLGLSLATSQVQAGVIFETGFEAPGYSPGLLLGQSGWTLLGGQNVAMVQTGVVASGTQALLFNNTNITQQSSVEHSLAYDSIGNPEQIVTLSIQAYISSSAGPVYWGVLGAFGNAGFLANVLVGPNMTAYLSNGASEVGSLAFTPDQWNTVKLVLDYRTLRQTAYVNDVFVASLGFSSAFTSLTSVYIEKNFGTSSSQFAAFDNLRIVSTPEPTSLVSAGLGLLLGAGQLVRRRRA